NPGGEENSFQLGELFTLSAKTSARCRKSVGPGIALNARRRASGLRATGRTKHSSSKKHQRTSSKSSSKTLVKGRWKGSGVRVNAFSRNVLACAESDGILIFIMVLSGTEVPTLETGVT